MHDSNKIVEEYGLNNVKDDLRAITWSNNN